MFATSSIRRTLLTGALLALFPLSVAAFSPPWGSDPDPQPDPTPPGDGQPLPPVDSVGEDGPYETTIDESTGPMGAGWVARPTNLGEDDVLHPVFIWGPGAGTGPSNYEDHLRRIASHGFVVYSEVSSNSGDEMVEAIDWLIQENNSSTSPYAGTLDTGNIAAGGHSRGSVGSFAIADDDRLSTTIHVAGGSFDGNGPDNLDNPAAYICGEDDPFATSNCERDYDNTTVPVWFTIMSNSDHMSAARDGLPAIVGWLRWHLAGEEERRSMFIAPDCDFCGFGYDTEYKNW